MVSINRELFNDDIEGDATDLQSNPIRHYDPTLGRWLSEEPIGWIKGVRNRIHVRTDKPFDSGISSTALVHDNGQVVLQFDAAFEYSLEDLEATDLSHRYLWGPSVDQLLADEQVTSLEFTGETLWAAADHQGSVTDVVDSNGDLRMHRVFDTFGNAVDEVHYDTSGDPVISSDPEFVTVAFAFTGRYFDPDTNLQNNLNRWFDMLVGRWLSEDPVGFAAGDANLRRYVGNSPTNNTDPGGLRNDWKRNEQGTFKIYVLDDPFRDKSCNSDVDVQYRVSNQDMLIYEKIELVVYVRTVGRNFLWGGFPGAINGQEEWHRDFPKPGQRVEPFPINRRGPTWTDNPGLTLIRGINIYFSQEWEAQAWGFSKRDNQWHLIKTARWGHRALLANGKYDKRIWIEPQ